MTHEECLDLMVTTLQDAPESLRNICAILEENPSISDAELHDMLNWRPE